MSSTKSESQASALFNTVNVLTFDVFGTLFDWESGVSKGLAGLYRRERSRAGDVLAAQLPIGDEIWLAFARAWRAGYMKATIEAGHAQSPSLDVEKIQRQRLDELLDDPTYSVLAQAFQGEEVRYELTMLWHKLSPWSDVPAAIEELKKKYTLAMLANGNVQLFEDLTKNANLPFQTILASDLLGSFKPNPKIYTLASQHLRPVSDSSKPSEGNPHGHIAHVAAHLYDLVAFRNACPGVCTVYVRRPTEETEVQEKVREKSGTEGGGEYGEFEVDLVVGGLDELARKLGCEVEGGRVK